jgi:predicted TIM-barrel fold metal-dependent hydrolase
VSQTNAVPGETLDYVSPKQRPGWLALAEPEEAIDPDLPIIDPHHHLWGHADDHYLLDDMLQDVRGGHDVRKTVYIQAFTGYHLGAPPALQPIGETDFAAAVARDCRALGLGVQVPAAIVSHADLVLGDAVTPVLEAHLEHGEGLVRGIRMIAARDDRIISAMYEQPEAGLMTRPDFRRGFGRLRDFGLSFDAYIYHSQLPELADLAAAFPDIPIVLNHSGMALGLGPYSRLREEVDMLWRRGIDALAALPNVSIKIGGMTLALWGFGFHEMPVPPNSTTLAEVWRPYVEYCIDRFGPARAMFESNFPPDKASCTYNAVWNAFKRLTTNYSDDERAALFHDTAARFYRL